MILAWFNLDMSDLPVNLLAARRRANFGILSMQDKETCRNYGTYAEDR